jgi:D-3-phosphoglycerate dehydrogenase
LSKLPIVVIPSDDPAQCQGSPRLDAFRDRAEVRLFKDRVTTVEEQLRRAAGATAVINSRSYLRWPAEVMEKLPDLKFIAVCGIGTDAIDKVAASRLGIVVSNLPGRTAPVVAEHAFGLMLAVAKRTTWHTDQLRAGKWAKMDMVLLQGKTVGIIGAGPIAAHMAKLCRGIGMNVLGWTYHPSPERGRALGIEFVPLDVLLARADVVSLHLPITDRSKKLLGRREIGQMKPGAILVNTGRGALVDEQALVDALNAGKLTGAGLDVFEQEPLPAGSPITKCEQVVLTPHIADMTPEGLDLLNQGVVENTLAFLDGKPQNVVNPA